MAQPDDSNIGLITTAAIGVILVVIAIVAAVEGLYWRYDKSVDAEKNVNLTYKQRAELTEAQQTKLIKVGLDKAMQETVKEQAAKQGAAGAK